MLHYLSPRTTLLITLSFVAAIVVYYFRLSIAEALVPYFRGVIHLVEHRMEIGAFDVIRSNGEYLYQVRLVSQAPITLYGQPLPSVNVSATTLVTHSLQHLVIFAAVATAGLLFGKVRLRWFLLALPVGLLISLGLDIPLVLLGSIEGLFLENLAPDQIDTNGFVMWERFMTNGGRMALAICLSLLSLGYSWIPQKPVSVPNPT